MRFALLGDHPDGLDLARALVESGRHQLAVYTGPAEGAEFLRRRGLAVALVGDLEEVLADPGVELVVVAGRPGTRPAQLRRALQSERHVLCVHPADQSPDVAYEAAMIQNDTGHVLLPLLPEVLHPGVARLVDLARPQQPQASGPLGALRLVELERWAPEEVMLEPEAPGQKPSVPGWDVLRAVGGEIAEVSALTAGEEIGPGDSLMVAGRFTHGGLLEAVLLSNQYEPRWRLAVTGAYGQAELVFPLGWPGPARLTWREETGEPREETWDTWNPWPTLVEAFESAVRYQTVASRHGPAAADDPALRLPPSPLVWQTAVRCLELDDAARRSVERRRTSVLEYQEASEEVGFKGTMTLVGCGLLWLILLLVIVAAWIPQVGWVIVPVLVGFLGLQLLRWLVPGPREESSDAGRKPPGD
jgi:predicted dehydrogenase